MGTVREDREAVERPARVGLFGLLGSGNTGNDVSMESVLAYLRRAHSDSVVDAMCGSPEGLRARYGIEAIPVLWYHQHQVAAGLHANLRKMLGKIIDVFRITRWVRRHDIVIVPGAGALEATLPTRPFGYPYSMFLLCAAGRVFGTKVALVSVGANDIRQRMTRWFLNAAARLAYYRSYRDELSREAMRDRGLDVTKDSVYPDLAFAAPLPPAESIDMHLVGVGVMDYHGGNDDRRQAPQIHASYLQTMKLFARWLVDSGYRIRLFGGDGSYDVAVANDVLADLNAHRPKLDPEAATVIPMSSFSDLMRELGSVGLVVATRYHNVLCALKMGKPTIALGYSDKFIQLMAGMGLADFCQPANVLDFDRLKEQFLALTEVATSLGPVMAEGNSAIAQRSDEQFALLSRVLFEARHAVNHPAGIRPRLARLNASAPQDNLPR